MPVMHAKWLREGLKRPGKSGAGLAKYLGLNPSAVSRMKTGERQIKADEVVRIAEYLGVEPPLIVDLDQEKPSIKLVHVVGIIAGGVWRETGVEPMADTATIPVVSDKGGPEKYALQVSGHSVNKVIQHGSYAICIPYWHARTEITDGDLVHVERSHGGQIEATIKRIKRIGNTWHLMPESIDPKFQEPIEYVSDGTDGVEICGLVIGQYSDI